MSRTPGAASVLSAGPPQSRKWIRTAPSIATMKPSGSAARSGSGDRPASTSNAPNPGPVSGRPRGSSMAP